MEQEHGAASSHESHPGHPGDMRGSRRQFLAGAALAGLGVAGARSRPPNSSGAATTQGDPATLGVDYDPGFLYGRILDTAADGTLAVLNATDCSTVRAVSVRSQSKVWKEGVVNQVQPDAGDVVYVRGEPDAANVLVADRLWVNIDNFPATVLATGSDWLSLLSERAHQQVNVHITSITRTVTSNGTEVTGKVPRIAPGDLIQVVTSGDRRTNERVATRIFGPSHHDGPEPANSDPTYTHSGISSWFCCGGNCTACGTQSGCGCGTCCCGCSGSACPSGCSPCDSSDHAMAWPKITKCDGSTCGPYIASGCSLSSTFPRFHCGDCVDIKNPCNGNTERVKVRDCGPTVRCVSAIACKGYTKVKFDLTPCAFSALASLDRGLIDLQTTDVVSC